MSQFFVDYKEAHTAAVVLARQLGKEVGLEKGSDLVRKGYVVFSLPKPENRFGHELRCEVVGPTDPL